MLTYGRWFVLACCFAAVLVIGWRLDRPSLVLVGAVGALTCAVGVYIDVFRNREVRALKEEVTIHRRTEARLRNLNQRGRA